MAPRSPRGRLKGRAGSDLAAGPPAPAGRGGFRRKGLFGLAGVLAGVLLLAGQARAQAWEGWYVDESNCVAVNTSLAVDIFSNPHIAHHDMTFDSLRYVFNNGAVWQTRILDSGGGAGMGSSIAVGPDGSIHLSYLRNGYLTYLKKVVFDWQRPQDIVGAVDSRADNTSLAVDGLGRPHILFSGGELGLNYVRWDGEAWQVEPLGFSGSDGYLKFNSSGRPYIIYLAGEKVWFARQSAGAWLGEEVEPGAEIEGSAGLAVDAFDRVHTAYRPKGTNIIRYAWWDGWVWRYENAAFDAGPAEAVRLDVDYDGNPQVAYTGSGWGRSVNYAYRAASGWAVEVTHPGGAAAIAVDPVGRPHLAHGRPAAGFVAPPWPVGDCQVLRYALRR